MSDWPEIGWPDEGAEPPLRDAAASLGHDLSLHVDNVLVVLGIGVACDDDAAMLSAQLATYIRRRLAEGYEAPSLADRQESLAALQRDVDDYRRNFTTEAPTWLRNRLA